MTVYSSYHEIISDNITIPAISSDIEKSWVESFTKILSLERATTLTMLDSNTDYQRAA